MILLLTQTLSMSSCSAVGFVLTAKSVAGCQRIEEQKEFGEYYLIGTLTSATIAILAGLLARVLFVDVFQ